MKKFKVKNLRFKVEFVLLFIFFTFNILLLPVSPLGGSFNIASAAVVPSQTLKSNSFLNSGLIGWWTMDGKDMLNGIVDLSPTYATGTITFGSLGNLSTTTESGRLSQALRFDGSDDTVTFGQETVYRFTQVPFSVSLWFKTKTGGCIISKGGGSSNGGGWSLCHSSGWFSKTGAIGVTFKSNGGTNQYTLISDGQTLGDDRWHHLVAVMNMDTTVAASNTAAFYIDGESYASTPGGSGGLPVVATYNLRLGARQGTGGINSYFNGSIDDVRFYNYAVSSSTIKRLYNLGATSKIGTTIKTNSSLNGPGSGLVGHWTFDGKDITQNIADVSGSYATGSLIVGSSGNTSTTTAYGRLGQALKFDGVDDKAIVDAGTYSAKLNGKSAASFSLWFNERSTSALDQTLIHLYIRSISNDSWNGLFAKLNGGTNNIVVGARSVYTDALQSNSGSVLSAGKWYHIVGIADYANSKIYIYVNGVLNSTLSATFGAASWTDSGTHDSAHYDGMGWQVGLSSDAFLNGSLDDVRVYNRALSAGEVKRLYDLGATTKISTTVKSNKALNGAGSGLVGHWTFDGANIGPAIMDISGSYATGSLIVGSSGNTSTTTAYGRLGQALSFDGDDHINVVSNTRIGGLNTFTYSAWIKKSGLGVVDSIISKRTGASSEWVLWFSSGKLQGQLFQTPGQTITGNTTVSSNVWHHVVFSSDGTNLYLYLDGVQDATPTTKTVTISEVPTAPFQIGWENTNSSRHFNGLIDDVRVYNRALSAGEVKRLYDLGR